MREVTIHKGLAHPHIIRLYNAFQEGPTLYIILEYMDRGNIFKMIRERSLNVDTAVHIFSQIMGALAYFHAKNIIHRDIKPENILWNNAGVFKLSDFGFCGDYLEAGGRKTMCGTTEYIAPEVIMSDRQTDRLDIWCMGILLYEMMHFRAPYQVKNTYWLMHEIKTKKIDCDPSVPKELQEIIFACLNVDPMKRPTAQTIIDSYPIVKRNLDNGTSVRPSIPSPLKTKADAESSRSAQDRFNFKKQRAETGSDFNSPLMGKNGSNSNGGSNYSNSSNQQASGTTKTNPVMRTLATTTTTASPTPAPAPTPTVGLYSNHLIKTPKDAPYVHKYHVTLPGEKVGPSLYSNPTSATSTQDSKKVSCYSNESGQTTGRLSEEAPVVHKSNSGYHLHANTAKDASHHPSTQTLTSKPSSHFLDVPKANAFNYSNTVTTNTVKTESKQGSNFTPDVHITKTASHAILRPSAQNNPQMYKEYPEARLYTESNHGLTMKRLGDIAPTNPQFVNIYNRTQAQGELFRTQVNNKPTEYNAKTIRTGSLTNAVDPSKNYSVRVIAPSPVKDPSYPARTMDNFRYSHSHASDVKVISPKPKDPAGMQNEDRTRRHYSAEKLNLIGPGTLSDNQVAAFLRTTTADKNPRAGQVTAFSNGNSPRKGKTLRSDGSAPGYSTDPQQVVTIRSISRGHSGGNDAAMPSSQRFQTNPFAPRKI